MFLLVGQNTCKKNEYKPFWQFLRTSSRSLQRTKTAGNPCLNQKISDRDRVQRQRAGLNNLPCLQGQ